MSLIIQPDPSTLFFTNTEHTTEVNTVPWYQDPDPTPSASESGRRVPIGPIVGGAIGGVAVAILLGFLIYQFLSVSLSLAVVINLKFFFCFKKRSGKAIRKDRGSSDEKRSESDGR